MRVSCGVFPQRHSLRRCLVLTTLAAAQHLQILRPIQRCLPRHRQMQPCLPRHTYTAHTYTQNHTHSRSQDQALMFTSASPPWSNKLLVSLYSCCSDANRFIQQIQGSRTEPLSCPQHAGVCVFPSLQCSCLFVLDSCFHNVLVRMAACRFCAHCLSNWRRLLLFYLLAGRNGSAATHQTVRCTRTGSLLKRNCSLWLAIVVLLWLC